MTEFLIAAFILAGALLMLIASIGLLRLPDVLCRSHAVAKALTLGVFLLLLGLWLNLEGEEASLKILLAIFFQLVTIPVASHLVGLLALKKNLPLWKPSPPGVRPAPRAE
jgi:multicomponent Na+:H+ antiporter subunit G